MKKRPKVAQTDLRECRLKFPYCASGSQGTKEKVKKLTQKLHKKETDENHRGILGDNFQVHRLLKKIFFYIF